MNSTHSFCPECGSEAAPDASFCGDCGRSLLTNGDHEVDSGEVDTQVPPSADIVEPPIAKAAPRKRRGVLIAALILLLIAAAAGILLTSRGSSPKSPSTVHTNDKGASLTSDASQVASCESLLPVSDVTHLTNASTITVHSFAQPWSRFPVPPSANCHYDADAAQNGGIADLGKSVVLWLWLHQPDSPQVYDSLAAGYPYGDTSAIKPFSGLGRRAVTDFSSVIVQASAVDTFVVSVGGPSDWLKSIYIARQIVRELTTGSSGSATGNSAPGGASGPTTPTPTPANSGNSGSSTSQAARRN